MQPSSHSAIGTSAAHRFLCIAYIALALVFAVMLLRNHINMIVLPTPLDIYEGLMPLITGLIASGENPYTFEYQPVYDDFYPPLYNILVAPFTFLFENNYQLHRGINAVLILACCGLCFRLVQTAQQDSVPASSFTHVTAHATAATVLLYAALIYYSTPIASTNALGVLLMMLTAIVPWQRGFDTPGLACALVMGVLAFYAKQYYACSAAFLAMYLFLYVSKQRALLFALAYALALLLTLFVVHKTSPYFLDNTLWAVIYASSTIRSIDVLFGQLAEFLRLYAGVIAFLAVTAVMRYSAWSQKRDHGVRGSERASTINLLNLRQPLFSRSMDYFWFLFWGATAVIVLALGWHPANYMSYLFQLMSPFFLIGAFRVIQRHEVSLLLIIPLMAYSFFHTWNILWKDFDVDQSQWQRAEEIIANNENILASQVLLLPLMKHERVIHQAGHTFYFNPAENKPEIFRHPDPKHQVSAVWDNYMAGLYRQVENKEFDVVMLHAWDIAGIFLDPPAHIKGVTGPEYFKRFYERTGVVRLSLTKRPGGGIKAIQIWTPKK